MAIPSAEWSAQSEGLSILGKGEYKPLPVGLANEVSAY